MRRVSFAGALGAFMLAAAPVMAQPADLIAAVPRGGSVDVPLSMDRAWRTVRPLALSAEMGPRKFATDRNGTFGGKPVAYQAQVSEMVLKEAGQPVGSLFYTAYLAKNAGDAARRPVVVIFNGGPGGSSGPLHFSGAWGPRKLKSGLVKDSGDPANTMVDNAESPLDAMDLVFLDPPETGFSRSAPGKANLFRSVDGDSEAVSQALVAWLRANGRLGSPLYIGGESYGSLRVIAMGRDIRRIEPAANLKGVIIMGPAPTFAQNGRTPNPLFVAAEAPMMASIAYRYGKIDTKGQTWEQAVEKARVFGRKEWLPALVAGHDIGKAEFDRMATTLPKLIGIPESYFRQNRTIAVADFNRELLRAEGLVLDRNNGLETSKDGKGSDYAALAKKISQYYADELKVSGLGDYWYVSPADKDASTWDFVTSGAPALDVTLATLMKDNPGLRVQVIQGRHDTLTDLGTTEYVMAQTDLDRSRYGFAFYDGGHLMANTPESNKALRYFVAGK